MKLEEIPLLIQLVGVAVQKCEDWLQLWRRVVGDLHKWRLICVHH
jgi:hypothetical protein